MADLSPAETLILEFERAWQEDRCPNIQEHVQRVAPASMQSHVLRELICIDLEYRWRSTSTTDRAKRQLLDDYVRHFPELRGLDSLPLELVQEEYRVRCRWGDCPSHEVFLKRFRERQSEILALLQQTDRELENEQLDAAGSDDGRFLVPPKTVDSAESNASLSFHDYLLEAMIGSGQMGKVYRAWQHSAKTRVAVKYLRKALLRDPRTVTRFLREAEFLAELQHSGIVGIQGLGRTPFGGYFVAMDLIAGGDLTAQIAKGPIPLPDAMRWIIDAATAIGYAHDRGIIHCDLKPGNLLLSASGSIVITDFGLARSMTDEGCALDFIAGTAPYMASEQVSSWWGPITPRTDIYGLGAVLYALLTGVAPYSATSLTDTLSLVMSGVPVVPPRSLRSDLPTEVSDVCLRCLAKSPEDRFASAGELLVALRACRL